MEGISHARIGATIGPLVGHFSGREAGFAAVLHPAHLPEPVEGVVAFTSMALTLGAISAVLAWLPDADTDSTLGAILPKAWHWITPGHRKGSHSLLALAAWWLFTAYASAGLGVPPALAHLAEALVVCAVASHLLADALTAHGIRPLYPFSSWHLRVVGFTSGSRPEPWCVAGAFVLVGLLIADPLHWSTAVHGLLAARGIGS